MIDINKVIKGLETQLDDLQKYADVDETLTLTQEQAKEIIELLKEQQNRIEVLRSEVKRLDVDIVRCKDCKFIECITRFGDIVCDRDGSPHRPEWFCPIGEPRE